MKINFFFKFCLFISICFIQACGGLASYQELNNHMAQGNCVKALEYIKSQKSSYGTNQELLYFLDSGMINLLCSNHEESNNSLHAAEELAEKLWTKSITKEAAAFIVNDYTVAYGGEDFEKALINLFSAINYILLDNRDEALVECRRLDANLSMLNKKYEKKNVYNEDALARYLSAILYESSKEFDDSYIDYYKSYKIYQDYNKNYGTQTPKALIEDLLRLAEKTDRMDDLPPDVKSQKNIKFTSYKETSKLSEVVLVHLNGKSPVKEEDKIFIPTNEGPITIAFPKYKASPPLCQKSEFIIEKSGTGESTPVKGELVEDINRIAVKNLDDRKVRIIAKAIARAVVKQAIIKKSTEDQSVRFLLNLANTIIEKADTRTWRTLPGEIYMARTFMSDGEYKVYNRSCKGEKRFIKDLFVKKGKTQFVLFESMY